MKSEKIEELKYFTKKHEIKEKEKEFEKKINKAWDNHTKKPCECEFCRRARSDERNKILEEIEQTLDFSHTVDRCSICKERWEELKKGLDKWKKK